MKKITSVLASVALMVGTAVAVAPVAQAACGGNIKLYFQGGLTGPYAQVGINESRGMKLAIDEYNKKAKTKVTYDQIDTQGSGAQSPALAAKVVADDCAVGVVGGMYSGETLNAVPVYEGGNVPVISPSATNPALSGKSVVFHRVVANDLVQGPALAKLATEKAGSKVFVVDDATPYGKGLIDIVKKRISKSIVGSDAVTEGTTNFTSVVSKVRASKANVVIYGGYFPEAAIFIKALRDNPATSKVLFLGGDGVLDNEYIKLAGKNANGTVLTAPYIPMDKAAPALTKRYKKAFGADPGVYTLETYNAARFFLAAIAAGNKTRPDILQYIKSTEFKGVGQTISFDSMGDVETLLMNAFVIKNGKIELLKRVQ